MALRQAQGITCPVATDTVNAVIDAFITAWPSLPRTLSATTQAAYGRYLKIARNAWGALKADGLRPVHIQAMMDGLAPTPGKANAFLGAMSALSVWARARDHISQSFVEGVRPFELKGGHKPWTPAQIEAATRHLTGVVRRGLMLYLYTGQRGSDVVRLGPTDIDEGGFSLTQQKTGRPVWCPIVPELAAEMATWERRPGPYLLQDNGKPYDRRLFWLHFNAERAGIPELADVTLHGLRCTAVIRLRRAGLSTGQIGDITGMSLQTIQKYCRFADRKASGQAALLKLAPKGKKNNEQTQL
jgi:integrase